MKSVKIDTSEDGETKNIEKLIDAALPKGKNHSITLMGDKLYDFAKMHEYAHKKGINLIYRSGQV